jgi:prepilin-type N-terminal cleavage/methylation domain-containing protein
MMNQEIQAEGMKQHPELPPHNPTTGYRPGTKDYTPQRHSSFIIHHSSFPHRGFTLIELLIVIGIIAILASLTFPALNAVKKTQIRTRARGELFQLETAIHTYKDKYGHYPPDSGAPYLVNQLYYELLGTTNIPGPSPLYRTLDGSAQISADPTTLATIFGPNVSGFINCNRATGTDEAATAVSFLKGLKPNQFLATTAGCTLLGTSLEGPATQMRQDASGRKINPWRYNSSNPRYNPKSFDLWMDVMVGGKTNRICNWSETPLVVGAPYP